MNEKLPKPMDDALRTQAPPKEHPSADLLVAYMEQSLPEAERHSVVSHLAQCGDCRQVLYLASGATEDSLAQQEAVIAAKKGRRWLPRLVWVGTAAAGLLLVGGYFVRDRMASQRHETLAASNQAVMRSESQPAQPQTQPQEASPLQGASNTVTAASRPNVTPHANSPAKKMTAVATVASAPPQQASKAIAEADVSVQAPVPDAYLPAPQAQGAKADSITIEAGSLPARTATTQHYSFAPSAGSEHGATNEAAARVDMMNRAQFYENSAGNATWRVDSKGCVEHLSSEGWTRSLADQSAVFRTVYARGDSVWAGGDSGILFHSSDGGAQWKKVVLSAENGPEAATIATIHFSSPQNGVVITSAGTIYATADGGATWTRR